MLNGVSYLTSLLVRGTQRRAVEIINKDTGEGVGGIDFFDLGDKPWNLTLDMVEKWWSLGTTRNRVGVWVQGTNLCWQAKGDSPDEKSTSNSATVEG